MAPRRSDITVQQHAEDTVQWHTLDAHQWRDAATQHGAVTGIRAALERIERRNDYLNAFTIILREESLSQAEKLDQLPADQRGPLHGVPVAIKDEVDVAGCVTSFGTSGNSTPRTEDSLIVQRLRAAGAIIIGKTAMPAFGAFPFTESQRFGITRNPVHPAHTPGGSSGGSAAAVADGMVPLAIGGDGGGSVRIPADHCGIVGLKPARGVVPSSPYEHLWYALGTAGPLARTVADVRLAYSVIAGDSTADSDISDAQPPAPTPLRIGVSVRPLSPLTRLVRENRRAVRRASDILRSQGHTVTDIDLRHPDPAPAFLVQFFAGIRAEIAGLEHPRRIEARHRWTRVLGAWASGPVLRWALAWSERFGQRMERTFAEYDVLLTPTVAGRPRKAGVLTGKGLVGAGLASMPSVAYTAVWNVSGHPGLTVPMGLGEDGLPTSVQLIGSVGDREVAALVRAGEQLMRAEGAS
ncbi:amidase [Corynebacterium sp. 320]|nr:amidase [Corynebacterium sp. 320]KAB1553443.1 amidase [Corynebacterium sp. 321]KAB3528634.1 amidase [Corynebacterium sp. 250]QNP93196.1 amidase [Corynebacterium zhongnanshanii]